MELNPWQSIHLEEDQEGSSSVREEMPSSSIEKDRIFFVEYSFTSMTISLFLISFFLTWMVGTDENNLPTNAADLVSNFWEFNERSERLPRGVSEKSSFLRTLKGNRDDGYRSASFSMARSESDSESSSSSGSECGCFDRCVAAARVFFRY